MLSCRELLQSLAAAPLAFGAGYRVQQEKAAAVSWRLVPFARSRQTP